MFIIFSLDAYSNRHQYMENYMSFIKRTEVLSLFILFFIFLFLIIANIQKIKNTFNKITKKYFIFLFLLILLSVLFVIKFIPIGNRLYFDEDIYLDMAKQIRTSGMSALCDFYTNKTCFKYELMKWPAFYPLMISLIPYKITWTSVSVFNIIISALTGFIIFLLSYLLTKDEVVSMFSSFLFLITPLRILWSTSNASETFFSFMIILTIFLYILFDKTKNNGFLFLSFISLILTSQTKLDGIVLIIPFTIILIANKNIILKTINRLDMLLLLTIILLLSVPFVLRYITFSGNSWGASGNKFDISYLNENVPNNFKFLLSYDLFDKGTALSKQMFNNYFSGFLFLISIPVMLLYSLKRRDILILTTSFLSFFIIYSMFYAGSVTYGVDVRYMLAVLSILPSLQSFIFYLLPRKKRYTLIMISIVLILISFFAQAKYMFIPLSNVREAIECRVYHNFVTSHLKYFNSSCIFITHVTSIYTIGNRNSIQIWLANSNPNLIHNDSCLILDYGYWCLTSDHSSICNDMLRKYKHKMILSSDPVNGKQYKFYRLYS